MLGKNHWFPLWYRHISNAFKSFMSNTCVYRWFFHLYGRKLTRKELKCMFLAVKKNQVRALSRNNYNSLSHNCIKRYGKRWLVHLAFCHCKVLAVNWAINWLSAIIQFESSLVLKYDKNVIIFDVDGCN